ncbi:flagellar brake protein [Pseudoduganella sp. OTU4001]|uniref:flagellar brake protein n=1 Tax=Pseudoduganella sp. OTU4001 TaxID=3043854 RepID=UPI00313ED7AB
METEDEIGDALTVLATHGDCIAMYAAGSREPVLGRILSVDPEQPHFVMELNEGSVLPPGKITFATVLGNSKMQFKLSSQDWKSLPGQPHLIPLTFPETCTVLNRRAFERVETPVGSVFEASFVMNGTTPYELTVFDLSQGGLGLRGSKAQMKGLLRGRKVRDVVLALGDESITITEMEVRVTRSVRSFLLGEQLHLGCKFTIIEPEEEARLKAIVDEILHNPGHR